MTGQKFSYSIAIPTYESAQSLVKTIETIFAQNAFADLSEILIVVDGKPMSEQIREQLQHKKIRIVQKKKQLGQSRRLRDIFSLSQTDLLIVTNDDVLLHQSAIRAFIQAYKKTGADLFSGTVSPLRGKTTLRKILAVSYDINKMIIRLLGWKTYLTTNGRLIALSKSLYKDVIVPEKLQNNDAFLYLFARVNGYRHVHVEGAQVYFHSPNTIDEHMKQSSKFQRSKNENQRFFKQDLSKYYRIPKLVAFYALFLVLIRKPILTTCYVGILGMSRLSAEKRLSLQTGVWQTDMSTKEG